MNNRLLVSFVKYKERLGKKYLWIFYIFFLYILVRFIQNKLFEIPVAFDEPLLKTIFSIAIWLGSLLVFLFGTIAVIKNANYPFEYKKEERALKEIDFVNSYGEPPSIIEIEKVGTGYIYHLFSPFLSIDEYEKNSARIENALNLVIREITCEKDQQHISLKAIKSILNRPKNIPWEDTFLSDEDFVIKLGQGDFNEIYIDLSHLPHILLASSTGGGKTFLLNLILLQSKRKGAEIGIIDFKGGMDYQYWSNTSPIYTTAKACLEYLNKLNLIMDERKTLLILEGVKNIKEYNAKSETHLPRIIAVFDEVADVLGVKKKDKESKNIYDGIEDSLSRLTRMGRAFGIHIILCYQRPSSDVLTGDIKANLGIRICGRADKIMSQMVLETDDAAEMIRPDDEGCFVTNMGGFFKAYYFDPQCKFYEMEDTV